MAFHMYDIFNNHVFHVSKHFKFDLVSKHFINVINKQKTIDIDVDLIRLDCENKKKKNIYFFFEK